MAPRVDAFPENARRKYKIVNVCINESKGTEGAVWRPFKLRLFEQFGLIFRSMVIFAGISNYQNNKPLNIKIKRLNYNRVRVTGTGWQRQAFHLP